LDLCKLPRISEMEAKVFELKNGLRVVYRHIPYTRAVHCGYVINSGSRDDREGQQGMAHFIEHMIFKGTSKRKTFHILNYLESVGGDVNAYTTKEKTCLYASLAANYFERAVELLTDITFHSTFPEKELDKEKRVISEEIDMYRNTPDEAIFEDFDQMIFPEHSLGDPILGTKDSIRTFTKDHISKHLRSAFTRENVVFGIVGNVKEKEVEKVIAKYIAPIELPGGNPVRYQPNLRQEQDLTVANTTEQIHEIIGGRAFPMQRDLYVPFLLLNNLLGGPAMNSRLNLNIREKHGLSYSISSFYTPYLDSGIWGIYFACDPDNLNRIRRLVNKEMKSLVEKPLGVVRLNQAKKQLQGQLVLGAESLLAQMLGMSQDLLDFGRLTTFAENLNQIETVSAAQIQDAAKMIFQELPLSRITYRQMA
ncbi:MAG: pitrilysin family protein, partial [Bacteroidota bacterium]